MKAALSSTKNQRRRAMTRSTGVFLALFAIPFLGLAKGEGAPDTGPGSGSASDPTVGTLPMIGSGGTEFDQTITLRGDVQLLREALRAADGEGYVEVVDTGGGTAWVRFYGDVRVELDLALLGSIEVGLFGGFEGSGMHYVVGGPEGFAAPGELSPGGELPLDLVRAALGGLLDDPLYLYGRHRIGKRTATSMELGQDGSTIVLHQDV